MDQPGIMGGMTRWLAGGAACALALTPLTACRPDPQTAGASADIETEPEPTPATISFPTVLRSSDPAINELVDALLSALVAGDYARVRSMWTLTEDPPRIRDLEDRWDGLSSLSLVALQPVRMKRREHADLDEAEPAYALLLEVQRAPTFGASSTSEDNQAVLLLVREADQWRLSRAPKVIRQWVRRSVAGSGS